MSVSPPLGLPGLLSVSSWWGLWFPPALLLAGLLTSSDSKLWPQTKYCTKSYDQRPQTPGIPAAGRARVGSLLPAVWGCQPSLTMCPAAIALLKDKEPGAFLIRDSHSFQGAYGLALKVATPPPSAQPWKGMEGRSCRARMVEGCRTSPWREGARNPLLLRDRAPWDESQTAVLSPPLPPLRGPLRAAGPPFPH